MTALEQVCAALSPLAGGGGRVLAALDGAPMLLSRGVLYTAITRARELLVIVGDDAAIRSMAANDKRQKRYSGLKWRLCHAGDANGE